MKTNPETATRPRQNKKAEQLRTWHAGEDILLLPCAWDVASAMVFEAEGFKAIGTTSLGVAATQGYADGQKIEFQEYLRLIRRITEHINSPVTVDIEAGFATSVEGVAANVEAVLRAGAVGINIEDENHGRSCGLVLQPVTRMTEKIQAIRAMSSSYGVSLFINAKTDAVWLSVGNSAEEIFQEAVTRANAYGSAGADCVFVPGDLDLEMITRLVKAIHLPLNIVAKIETPPVSVLRTLGVKRLSLGSGPMRATMGLTRKISREILSSGTCQSCFGLAIPFYEFKEMFDT